MFVMRVFNHRKVMLYSFYVLFMCIMVYVLICLGAYFVDSQEKLFPAGLNMGIIKEGIKKRESSLDTEPLKVIQNDDNELPIKNHQGRVNLHVFEDCCGGSIDQLRSNMLYPLFPNLRTTVSRLAVSPQWKNYGLRIFGYIHPSVTGEYIFAVASDDNSEFWISVNESPKNLRRLVYIGETGAEWTAPGEYWKFASQISKPVFLLKDIKYFFEVLLKQNDGMDHLEIAWRLNQHNTSFTVITSEFLSLYKDESSLRMGDIDHIPQTKASYDRFLEPIPKSPHPAGDMNREDPRDHIYKITMMDESYLKEIFPECHYKPSYIIEGRKLNRYEGVNLIHFSSVFPNDYTRQTHAHGEEMCFYKQDPSFQDSQGLAQYLKKIEDPDIQNKGAGEPPLWQHVYDVKPLDVSSKLTGVVVKGCRRAGNIIMTQNDAMPIVKTFIKGLYSREDTRGFSLLRVLNVERRMDSGVGSRYLVELELVSQQGQKVLVSHYVYVPEKTSENAQESGLSTEPILCSPKGFYWKPSAVVHIIVAVKNQARWIILFIREMEKLYRATGDKNFNVIIIDYNSTDMNIEKTLKKAKLPSYQFKKMKGNFQRSAGLQAGIDLVKDEHSILFLCDLHLYYPVNLLNSIRKHSVEGKLVFAPIVMRLDCGASLKAPTGFWETAGYGLMGIYKSDMVRIGGMNTIEFKDKWGGEDWELLDRVLQNGLEVERLHLRNFLHHFHSKRGLWENNEQT